MTAPTSEQPASTPAPAHNEIAFRCLLSALDETHASIRAYDTKAQIVGIGFIFSIGVLSNLIANFEIEREYGILYLLIGFLLLIGPVILFGAVLFPSRKIAPSLGTSADTVRHCYYYQSDTTDNLQTVLDNQNKADWQKEITYELMKVSLLRDLKRKRFIRALLASGASFIIIVAANAIKLTAI